MDSITIQVRIAGIRETRFFIQEASGITAENFRPETAYHINANTVLETETDLVVVIFDIRLALKQKPEVTLLHYVAQMRYELGGFDMSAGTTPDRAGIPSEIMLTLIGTAYSTFRGTLYARCAGSVLREATLPLSDASVFIQQHQSFEGPIIAKPPLQEE